MPVFLNDAHGEALAVKVVSLSRKISGADYH